MKKIGLFCFMLFFAIGGKAQMYFDAGIKGAFGPTVLFNKDIFDSADYRHNATMGFAYGGKLGINFNGKNAITLDLMRQTSRQELEFDIAGSEAFTDLIEWNHTDLLLLYRFSGKGAYIEIGPKISNISEVTHEINGQSTTIAATPFYEDNYLSGVFGFGSYLAGSDLVTLQIGIRIHFAIDDMVNESGKEGSNNYPTPLFPQKLNNAKTLATAAMLQVELNYAFGRFAKAQCSDRRKLILFQ